MPVDRDLADITLAERLPMQDVRARTAPTLPEGIEIVDMYDVWLGAPPLAASLAAADYRLTLDTAEHDLRAALARASADLLRASTLMRERTRGSSVVSYDLRPLVADVRVGGAGAGGSDATPPVESPVTIRIRTLFHPERGAGRPEEVLAALAERTSRHLDAVSIVRERLILADDRDG
jgi:hypothetical protein